MPWLTQKRLLIAAGLVLAVCSLLPAKTITALTRGPQQWLAAAVSPPIWLADRLTPDLRSAQPSPILGDASKQRLNDQLSEAKAYIGNLERKLARARREIQQLQETEARLGAPVNLVRARVVGVSDSSIKPALTIDCGRRSGIDANQAVVFAGNLVGVVEMAGPVTATVRLITAAGTSLNLRLKPAAVNQSEADGSKPGKGQGRLEVFAELTEGGEAFIAEPARAKPVEQGYLAHLSDASWPIAAQGAIVGKVASVAGLPEQPLLVNRVRIEPLAPLKQLDRVTVLVPQRRGAPAVRSKQSEPSRRGERGKPPEPDEQGGSR